VPSASLGELRLFVDRMTISEVRTLQFRTGESSANQTFTIELVAEGPTDEAVEAIFGFDTAVEAMDDTGRRLVSEVRNLNTGQGSRYPNPDQWRQYLSLPPPHPRAKKLAYLTGELLLYRRVKPARLEIPLPLAQKPFSAEVGGVRVTVLEAVPRGGDFVARVTLAPAAGATGMGEEAQLQLRPLLVTASGRRYRTSQVTAAPAGGDPTVSQQQVRFAHVREAAAKLVYDVTVKSMPDRRVRYRITDIPLPPLVAAQPAPAAGGPAAGPAGAAEGIPFYHAGGGTLVVRIQGAPAGAAVSLGLARQEGAAWSGWRWAETNLGLDGTVRLGPLRPGTYRARYTLTRPDGAIVSSQSGAAPVRIVAGRETPAVLKNE
jgi:hypothetical protein